MNSGSSTVAYKRVLLKLSGEALKGKQHSGIDVETADRLVSQIKEVVELGVELALVIGGGNIFRGINASKTGSLDRVTGDHMGMLATVINGLALQNMLENKGVSARVQSALDMTKVTESYVYRKTQKYLKSKKVVIFVAGTGNPFFSTDTAAALRASEIGADVLMKATKVSGVYSDDPVKNPDAEFYPELTYADVLSKRLKVMDSTAISLSMDNEIPILVFDIAEKDSIKRAVLGQRVGTIIRG